VTSPSQTVFRLAVSSYPLAGCSSAVPAAVLLDGSHCNAVLLYCHAPTTRYANISSDVTLQGQ